MGACQSSVCPIVAQNALEHSLLVGVEVLGLRSRLNQGAGYLLHLGVRAHRIRTPMMSHVKHQEGSLCRKTNLMSAYVVYDVVISRITSSIQLRNFSSGSLSRLRQNSEINSENYIETIIYVVILLNNTNIKHNFYKQYHNKWLLSIVKVDLKERIIKWNNHKQKIKEDYVIERHIPGQITTTTWRAEHVNIAYHAVVSYWLAANNVWPRELANLTYLLCILKVLRYGSLVICYLIHKELYVN